GDIRVAVLYKVAGASEPTSYTIALGGGTNDAVGSMVAFSGVDQSSVFDVAPNALSINTSGSSTITASELTSVTPGSAVIMFTQVGNDHTFSNWLTTNPGTLAELYDTPFNSTDDLSVGAAWALKYATGATGNGTCSQLNSATWGAVLNALRPS